MSNHSGRWGVTEITTRRWLFAAQAISLRSRKLAGRRWCTARRWAFASEDRSATRLFGIGVLGSLPEKRQLPSADLAHLSPRHLSRWLSPSTSTHSALNLLLLALSRTVARYPRMDTADSNCQPKPAVAPARRVFSKRSARSPASSLWHDSLHSRDVLPS